MMPSSRRQFLKTTTSGLLAAGLPTWFANAAHAEALEAEFNQPQRKSANETIQIGLIGPGGSQGGYRQGLNDAKWAVSHPNTKVVAVCDVDAIHAREAADTFKSDFTTRDYRELLARPGIDAVIIGTPDHWHSTIAIAAMKAGKDVYCEKPLTLAIQEGKDIVREWKRSKRVFQTGSQQRSDARFRLAVLLVRNGRIGTIKKVTTNLPTGPKGGPFEKKPVPGSLDFNLWLGPAPIADYCPERVHGSFRWWLDYSGGMLTDWGAHHNDIMQWGLASDRSGPLSVRAEGVPQPVLSSMTYNTFPEYDVYYEYPNGVEVHCTNKGDNGVLFEGTAGWIFVSRGEIKASDARLIGEPLREPKDPVYVSDDHMGNWLDGIRTRKQPICDAEIGHRSASVCHMANISLRLWGRKLEWDAKAERFKNDDEANSMLVRSMRKWSR